jgi:CelD/BcsL family acetyltransferase involved in cellulose biosynthesis
VAAALPLLWDLHAARAAAPTRIRHLDYLKPVRRRAFMLEVAPVLAARGEAAIGMLTVDGKVVAAQLWFEAGRAMFLYYSGYDLAWARYSVGMLTTAEILKDALARGVRRVEFLRGANQFKSRWGTQARAETDFVLGRRRRLVAAQEAYARGRKRMRRKLVRWRTKLERLHVEESPPQN